MNLSNFDQLDPNLLPGLLNTALRNDCESLDDLARTHDLDQEALEQKLKHLGYHYVAEVNQFRPLRGTE
ncbi:MAG: DUF4250 domain-containing protein [Verrucomicrobiales bacterium]|nr:DUF4250 domain-containing protein [Verrucomicrobiales bacterium]